MAGLHARLLPPARPACYHFRHAGISQYVLGASLPCTIRACLNLHHLACKNAVQYTAHKRPGCVCRVKCVCVCVNRPPALGQKILGVNSPKATVCPCHLMCAGDWPEVGQPPPQHGPTRPQSNIIHPAMARCSRVCRCPPSQATSTTSQRHSLCPSQSIPGSSRRRPRAAARHGGCTHPSATTYMP